MRFHFRKITDEGVENCKEQLCERCKTTRKNDSWTGCTKENAVYILISCLIFAMEIIFFFFCNIPPPENGSRWGWWFSYDVNSKSSVCEEEQLGYTQDNDRILEVEKEAEPGE
jgi:hypothetical protein